MSSARFTANRLPRYIPSGELAFFLDRKLALKRDEIALAAVLMCDRQLFGYVYKELQPDYFFSMPSDSGVLVCQCAKTETIFPGRRNPGDIDLIVIPYEGPELILDKVLGIEIKIVRASYANQGKSPNDYGYSQASYLLGIGFPYAAVVHLIIADESPAEAWEEMFACTILDSEGTVSAPEPVLSDIMPMTLMDRSFGRLLANSPDDRLGLVSTYMGAWREEGRSIFPNRGRWMPSGRAAQFSNQFRLEAMLEVAGHYQNNVERFMRVPRFDPVVS